MLKTTCVAPATLGLVKQLMTEEILQSFILVGGTALALQIGHRRSIDIDLFTKIDFNSQELESFLTTKYGFIKRILGKSTLIGDAEGIKIDFIKHNYPDIIEPLVIEGVRMATLTDISAMKLNAIYGSGERLKDFVDIADLSASVSLQSMLEAFSLKYKVDSALAIRALLFHADINMKESIELLSGKFEWKMVEKRINEMTKEPNKVFPEMAINMKKVAKKDIPETDDEDQISKKQIHKGPKL